MYSVPENVRTQINQCVDMIKKNVSGLSSIYLHGSICLGGFVSGKSDIDIFAVSSEQMSPGRKTAFADDLLRIHKRPCDIELSVSTLEDVKQIPVMCQFHFSEYWAKRYAEHDETNPLLASSFPDEDIPSYLKLIRQQGIVLYGSAPELILPRISDEQFWNAISSGIEEYEFEDYGLYDSNILTLSRILSFAYERKIFTKVQGAEWGMRRFPQFKDLLEQAVKAYCSDCKVKYDGELLREYKEFMIVQILEGLRQR